MSRHTLQPHSVIVIILLAFAAFLSFAPAVDATPRQPSIAQKGENHKAECAEYGDSFESGTYTDADTGAVTNYSVCFSGDSMVICEWTATTDFCLGAIPGAIRNGESQLPPIDQLAPGSPVTPTPVPRTAPGG